MVWQYQISTGELTHDGTPIGTGYSGHGPYKNDPTATDKPDLGPLPCGEYTIGPPFHHPVAGPEVLRLSPEPTNDMYGRAGFLIHGDLIGDIGNASNGCIVLPKALREQIANSNDNDLTVIA